MSRISTHVLDTSTGKPAAGIPIQLFLGETKIASAVTDSDGRCPNLLPVDAEIVSGIYKLVFDVESYFPNGFYPHVTITFKATEMTPHYHVPLLVSPFGYTTYRGS